LSEIRPRTDFDPDGAVADFSMIRIRKTHSSNGKPGNQDSASNNGNPFLLHDATSYLQK